jgi:predicted secreted protein
VDVGETWSGRAVPVAMGEAVHVTLDERRTAGYRWRLEDAGEPVCHLAGDEYVAPRADLPGAAGVRSLTFVAVGRGSARITAAYARSWEKKPARTFTLDVTVR